MERRILPITVYLAEQLHSRFHDRDIRIIALEDRQIIMAINRDLGFARVAEITRSTSSNRKGELEINEYDAETITSDQS